MPRVPLPQSSRHFTLEVRGCKPREQLIEGGAARDRELEPAQGMFDRFAQQVLLGAEMVIERARRDADGDRDLRHAHVVMARGAKQASRSRENEVAAIAWPAADELWPLGRWRCHDVQSASLPARPVVKQLNSD